MAIHRPLAQHLADQHITRDLLQSLAELGPGGLIIANEPAGEFRLTHHRYLRPAPRENIVYGYGDLTHDWDIALLTAPGDPWPQLARIADHLAHACLEWDPWEPVLYLFDPARRRFQGELRTAMLRQDFVLLRRPMLTGQIPEHRLQDTYLDTTHLQITLTVAASYPDPEHQEAFTWCTHQGVFHRLGRLDTHQGPHRLAENIRHRLTHLIDQT